MDPLLHNFIIEHQNDDTDRLLLARRDRWPGIDVPLAVNCIVSRRKLKDKLPSWYERTDLLLPLPLSAEQCSSGRTAEYKAAYAAEIFAAAGGKGRPRVADLTGGFGVDCAAFSEIAEAVLYNEMNPSLVEAAEHNFPLLGVDNVTFANLCVGPDAASVAQVLGAFIPDIIFLDPARRSSEGKKVFRLADCSPDVLALKDELLGACPNILLKLSPMADISQICRELGDCVREVRIVESAGECKELLVWLNRGWNGRYAISVATETVLDGTDRPFAFTPEDEASATASFAESFRPGGFIFEPGKALLKSGAFSLMCSRFDLLKLAPSTHLYYSDEEPNLRAWGKVYEILECMPLSKASIKDVGARYPGADVTARNAHMTSEALAARLAQKRGAAAHQTADVHIFAAATSSSGIFLYVCKRLL